MALLLVLLELRGELGMVLAAVHFNHRIRGAEADADEQFVRELAAKLGLEFLCGSADVPAFSREHRVSLEAAARKFRYEYFATLLRREREHGTEGPGLKPRILRTLDPGLKPGAPTDAQTTRVQEAMAPTDAQTARVLKPGASTMRRKRRDQEFINAGINNLTPGPGPGFTLDKIATAHTQNDQAETVLMRLVRGAGTRGLSGIHARLGNISVFHAGIGQTRSPAEADVASRDVASYVSTEMQSQEGQSQESAGCIIRPLLAVTRSEITAYLQSIGQPWREDSSNRQLEHTRNRVRHELIPLLERDFNPAIIRVLAEHAQIAQAEEEFWAFEANQVLLALCDSSGGALRVDALLKLPLALQRHVVRAAAERAGLTLDFEHIEAVRRLASAEIGRKSRHTGLPGGTAELARHDGVRELMLRSGGLNKAAQNDYEYRLPVPGSVQVPEIGGCIRARLHTVQATAQVTGQVTAQVTAQEGGKTAFQSYNQPQLLNPRRLGAELTVRNWRPGDRFWPAHTKAPKKVKELLQKMTEAERKSWPVIISGNEIVWMRGFPPPASFTLAADVPASAQGLLIEEQEEQKEDR